MSEKNKKKSTNSLPFFYKIIKNYPIVFFILISIVLFAVIFRIFIFDKYLFYFKDIGSDTIKNTLPWYFEFYNLQKSGEGFFKFWSFYTGMGQQFQTAIPLSPLHYLILLLLKIFGLKTWFYRHYLIFFFNMLPAGIFGYLYFRTLNLSKYTAIIGALLIEFSGYMLIGAQWSHATRIFNTVLLLLAFEQLLQKKRYWIFPIAFYYLSSNMFLLATNVLFIGIYAFIRFFGNNFGKIKDFVILSLKMTGLAIIGILMNAPSAIGNFLKMYYSPRVAGDMKQISHLIDKPEQFDAYLRNITTILRFFANDILGAGSDFKGWYNYLEAPIFYIGLISLITFSMAFLFFNKKQKILYGILILFWFLVAFVPILRHSVNFFAGDYYKNTIDVFAPLTLLFFAMYAFDNLQKKENLPALPFVIITGILLILLHFPYFDFTNSVVDLKLKLIISVFLIIYAVLLYFLSNFKNKNLIKTLIFLFIFAELIFTSAPTFKNREICTKHEIIDNYAGFRNETVDAINFIKQSDTTKFFRIEKIFGTEIANHESYNDNKIQNYFGTASYNSFNNNYYIKFLEDVELIEKGREAQSRWCSGVRGVPLLMTFANVKYFLTKNANSPLLMSGYDSIALIKGIYILENKNFLPFGYSYNKYLPYDDFMKLSKFKKQLALLNAVIIDDSSIANKLPKLDTNTLVEANKLSVPMYQKIIDSLRYEHFVITSFKHKRIDGNITLSSGKFLFFTIPYNKGWRIIINGKKHKLIRSNIGFLGIYLPQGHYNITLQFIPQYFYLSVFLLVIGVILFFFIIIKTNKNNKSI